MAMLGFFTFGSMLAFLDLAAKNQIEASRAVQQTAEAASAEISGAPLPVSSANPVPVHIKVRSGHNPRTDYIQWESVSLPV